MALPSTRPMRGCSRGWGSKRHIHFPKGIRHHHRVQGGVWGKRHRRVDQGTNRHARGHGAPLGAVADAGDPEAGEYEVAQFDGKPAIEQAWDWELAPGLKQHLRMDAILRRKDDGLLHILDYKSAKYVSEGWRDKFEHSNQTELYVQALKDRTGTVGGMSDEGLIKGAYRKDTARSSKYFRLADSIEPLLLCLPARRRRWDSVGPGLHREEGLREGSHHRCDDHQSLGGGSPPASGPAL